MAPLPISDSSSEHWDANRMDEKLMSGDGFATLPGTPTTPEALEAKRKKRPKKSPQKSPKKSPQKSSKSPRSVPLSPFSKGNYDEDIQRQKQTIDSPYKERKTSAPPPPPLSTTSPTPVSVSPPTPRTDKSLTRNKSDDKSGHKSSNKSSNKSISNCSPRTDLKHRQVANAAAEAASRRRHRRPRKKLYWNNSVRVKVVHNLSNYTSQERRDAWYTADEYSMMEDECELTSIHMDEIAYEHDAVIHEEKNAKSYKRTLPAGFCERGLESWTMHGEELKEQQVQLVIDTVWQAQIDAWEFLGHQSPNPNETKDTDDNAIYSECWEFIRERASAVSIPSQLRAREFAIKDEQSVDSYLNSVRSLEQSMRRIHNMLGGKHCSSRTLGRSSRTLTTSKSSRTLTTVSSSGSRSFCGADNLKSILKSPKPKRAYSDTRTLRKSPSQSRIPLKSASEHSKSDGSSFRIRLPKIGNDSSSLRSKSLRSNSLRSNSLRSNSLRSNSLRTNGNSLRSSSLRSNLSRSQSVRTNSARSNSLRSNLSRSNSLRSNSLRSNSLRSHSLRSNSVHSSVSTSSLLSNSSRKIRFKPKSKTKIPTSPVGSVCSCLSSQNFSNSNHNTLSEEEDLSLRMMRSHMSMSVGSEGSSRRRMLRASTPMKPPL